MDLAMKLYDERQLGIAKGRKEGIQESAINVAKRLKKNGLSNQEIENNLNDFFGKDLSAKEIANIIQNA